MILRKIKFNKVTWYSRLFAIILFIAIIPVLAFYIGTQYQLAVDVASSSPVVQTVTVSKKDDQKNPKIDVGDSILEGKVYGMVQKIYEKNGGLWVDVDPAGQVSALECVFRAYDEKSSRSCEAPNGTTIWNSSTSTISLPLGDKAIASVYYNDGTKIGLKPRITNSKNGKLYTFSLLPSSPIKSTVKNSKISSSSEPIDLAPPSLSDLAKMYNRILSYDGDDTYRWNPLFYIDIKASTSTSVISSIEEVWRP